MKSEPKKYITLTQMLQYEAECAHREEEIEEAQRLIDCLVGSKAEKLESSRIHMPHPMEVQLNGWFAPEQLRQLADYMESIEC